MNMIKDRMIDTVLVDFDGTMMDTNELILNSWMYAIKTLTGKELPPDEIRATFGETIAFSMQKLMPGVEISKAVNLYRDYQFDKYLDNIHPFDGVEETLTILKDKGYKLAVVTSRLTRSTYSGLEHFNLDRFFEVVITADDCPEHKPHPLPLIMAMEGLDSKPEHTVMIGDTKHDIGAAKAAGVVSVLVDYSVALPPEKREAEKPDYVIEKFSDIITLLER